MRRCLLIVMALLFCGRAHGYMIHLDGYGEIHTAFADSRLVVLCKRVSGAPSSEMIGVDSRDGRILWRRNVDGFLYRVECDNAREFYAVNQTNLVCRSRSDGETLWSLNLSALAWTKQKESEGTHVVIRFDRPERFSFAMPFLNRDFFFLSRTGLSGAVDCFSVHSQDWVLLSRSGRRPLREGQGEFLASVQSAVLTAESGLEDTLVLLTSERTRDLSRALTRRLKDWDIDTSRSALGQSRSTRYCTFGVRAKEQNESGQVFYDKRAIYDAKERKIQLVCPTPDHRYQVNWVNSDEYVLRFSECVALWNEEDRDRRASLPFWVESHSTDGTLKGKLMLPARGGSPPRSSRHLGFQGITQDGLFAFVDHTYVFRDDAAVGAESDVHLLLVEPSVPRIARSVDLAAGDLTSSNVELLTDADHVVQVLGNAEIQRMDSESKNHHIVVRLLSLSDGTEIWRHDEPVIIVKED